MNIEELRTAFAEYHANNAQTTTEFRQQLGTLQSDLDAANARLAALTVGGGGGEPSAESRLAAPAVRNFCAYMRSGDRGLITPSGSALHLIGESRAATIDHGPAGGVTVPKQIADVIRQKLLDISPIRRIATTTLASSSDYHRLIDQRGLASGWAGEQTTRGETATPTLGAISPPHGGLYATPKTTQWLLQDSQFDVANWLINSVRDEFSYREGIAFVTGDGVGKPRGFLTQTAVSTSDSTRAFGALQYVATGVADGFADDRLGSPAGNPGDVLIDTVYALRSGYRQGAVWTMNSTTASVVRKWKDGDGRYLWTDGLQPGQPAMLLGHEVVFAEAMPDIAANALPIAFGDFKRGYEIVDVGVPILIRDETTSKGFVIFYVEQRVGGHVIDDDALKLIKVAAA